MPDVSFGNLLVVVAVAVLAPLTVGFFPRLRTRRPAGGDPRPVRPGVPALPRRAGDRRAPPAGTAAPLRRPRLPRVAGPGLRRRRVLHRNRVGVATAAAGDRALLHRARPGRA